MANGDQHIMVAVDVNDATVLTESEVGNIIRALLEMRCDEMPENHQLIVELRRKRAHVIRNSTNESFLVLRIVNDDKPIQP